MHDDSPLIEGDVSGNANALPKGTRLSEFEIERVLGEGGFAIVYLAFDHSLHRHVALKEYLPAEFAFRQDASTILLRSVQYQRTFEAGRKSFVEEARFLAQFEHPSLVKVHRVFEEHGTAYMVQGYYEGQSLQAMLKSGRRYTSQAEFRPIVAALLAAVELLHGRDCLHRDIAPDNIIVQSNGVPVLLDFGAARRIIGDMTQALTAVLKPSYAPIEQYTEDGGLAQGPWTDVYALAATLRAAITGKPPPSSVGRTLKDGLVKLADQPPPGFDEEFLRGIDAGLALLPADRPQSIAQFRAALGIEEPDEGVKAPRVRAVEATQVVAAQTAPVSAAPTLPPRVERPPLPTPPPKVARRRMKRADIMLIVIGAAALGLMLLVPFAADWIWPSPSSLAPPPRTSMVERPPANVPSPPAAPSPAPPPPAPPPPVTASPPPPAPEAPPVAAKDGKAAAGPLVDKPKPPPAVDVPPPKVAVREPLAAPRPREEAPPKVPAREASPPAAATLPSTSLIPSPSQPAPASPPTAREEAPPRPAVPAQAALPPQRDPAPKGRRPLVRVAGDPPTYPREAIRAGVQSGRVVALVTVDAQGNVADVAIVKSEPSGVFDRAARSALGAWRFRTEGERQQGEVELLFDLRQ